MMFKLSFYKETQKLIREEIKDDLVRLVLTHLPHLQLSKESQDDVWLFIAIKLNNKLLKESLDGTTAHHSDQKGIGHANISELPPLNGPQVKEIYDKIFKEFRLRAPLGLLNEYGQDPSAFITEPLDYMLYKLYGMQTRAMDRLTNIALDNLEEVYRSELKPEYESLKQYIATERNGHESLLITDEKETIYKEQLAKEKATIAKLEAENKRLLQLNQQLLSDMRQL